MKAIKLSRRTFQKEYAFEHDNKPFSQLPISLRTHDLLIAPVTSACLWSQLWQTKQAVFLTQIWACFALVATHLNRFCPSITLCLWHALTAECLKHNICKHVLWNPRCVKQGPPQSRKLLEVLRIFIMNEKRFVLKSLLYHRLVKSRCDVSTPGMVKQNFY